MTRRDAGERQVSCNRSPNAAKVKTDVILCAVSSPLYPPWRCSDEGAIIGDVVGGVRVNLLD